MLPLDYPYTYQGITYKTSENFYQAMKIPKNRADLRAEIAAMGPYEAKKAIRDKKKYPWRADWTKELSLKVMEFILKVKFAVGTNWEEGLILTDDEDIIEVNNWHDNFWGNCICDKCADKPGLNHLGRILMKIRESKKHVRNL